jgi:hypothetical protein
MNRRRLLRALAAGATGLATGCVGGDSDTSSATRTETAPATPTPEGTAATVGGVDLPVPRSELRTALPEDAIPAIIDPEFAPDWSGLDAPEDAERPLLPDNSAVVGVERGGTARAYPLRILNWHEVVNDDLGGPLLVTYCPLCGSSITAERRVAGEETVFGVSGKLWREDLVMYDRRTESLWGQILAAAIRGPRTGERLSLVPSELLTWGEWRGRHPDTGVLLPPPRSSAIEGRERTFRYFDEKYGYDGDQLIGYDSQSEDGLFGRSLVVGVEHDGTARAYPFETVEQAGVVNDRVGDLPVVVTTTAGGSMAAHVRRVDGEVFTFEVADERRLTAGGSRWDRTTGRAIDGPYEGTELDRATGMGPLFWKGWRNFHPDTDVYGE